jgi:hypothetical protein
VPPRLPAVIPRSRLDEMFFVDRRAGVGEVAGGGEEFVAGGEDLAAEGRGDEVWVSFWLVWGDKLRRGMRRGTDARGSEGLVDFGLINLFYGHC